MRQVSWHVLILQPCMRCAAKQDIRGYVYDFCKDQFGSRFIQQKLEVAAPHEVRALLHLTFPNAS